MIKGVEFVGNGLENTGSIREAVVFAEQANELGLEEVLIVEAVFYDQREDSPELFERCAELEEESRRVLVDVRGDVCSLGKRVFVFVESLSWC